LTHMRVNAGATRLEWSDDDGGFGSDDGGWGDGFDDDEDLGEEDKTAEITDDDNADDAGDDVAVEDKAMAETKAEETAEEQESGIAAASPAPTPAPSGGRPPPAPGVPRIIPNTPINLSSGDSTDGGAVPFLATPLSLAETAATPMVEMDDVDQDFEEIVRKRNRVRKEREDYHIAHVTVQMGRLEDALAAETKRRVDATTALDELARSQVHEMEERVRGQLREENERLQTRLTALEERVQKLEERFAADSNQQIELVNGKAADLSKSIAQIRDDQSMERKARLKREGILLQQVEGHAKEAEDRWNTERSEREQRLKELEIQVIRNEARLALEQKRYEDRIEKELTSLKEELEMETAERQTQDEEIVAALNRYTKQLQQSLSILSSD